MKKNKYTLIALAFIFISLNANALIYYVDGSKTDDTGNAFSWGTAKKTINAVLNLSITANDTVFVKSGTYSYSASSGTAFSTPGTKIVNLYGGFAGTESNTALRAKSDKDGNGIIEPWEFTNETVISLNITDANGLGLFSYYSSNPSTVQNIFDGFVITGTMTNTISSAAAGKSAIGIYGNWIFRNNTVRNWTITTNLNAVGAYAEGSLVKIFSGNNGGSPATQFGYNIVDNCLFEKNITTATTNATPNTDVRQAPFIRMVGSSTGDLGKNILKNSVIRNNKAKLDYSASGITVNATTRGFMIDFSPGVNATVIKNNIIHNNDAEFVCKTGSNYSATQGGVLGAIPNASTVTDSVVNNTIANNKQTRLRGALSIVTSNATQPYHKVLNNTVYNNTNYDGSATAQANIFVPSPVPNNSTAGMVIFNNVCSGGTTNLTNNLSNTATTNVYGNVTDLATENTVGNAPYFINPTTNVIGINRVAGSADSIAIARSRWTIGTSSYLVGKGLAYASINNDKSGFAFASSPAAGAYEQYTPSITGATTTSAFTSTYGTTSAVQQFSVSGTKLLANLNATAPTGYEVSTNGTSYGTTATIARGSGNPSGTLYVRLKSTNNAGNYNSANIVLSSTDANSGNISTPESGNTVSSKSLTIDLTSIASKVYDGNATSGTVTPGTLSGFVGSETVTVSSAVGTYADANVGVSKTATVTYTLANGTNGGLATNYSLANGTATGDITAISAPISSDSNLGNAATLPGTDVSVAAGNVLTVNNSTIVRSITLAPGAKLTLNSGQTLSATNGITLQSNANGTATLLNSGTYTGTINAEQYLGSARNWYVSSPVSNATSPSNNVDYYYEYVEAGNNNPSGQPGSSTVYWKGLANGTTMEIGKGYIAKTNTGATVQFIGTPNNGNITTSFNLTRNDSKGRGFNLVGNPYPSYLDWVDLAAANPYLDNTYYYRTKNSSDAYTFVTWNGAGSNYVVSNGSLAINTTVTRYIPPTQAFWVRVKTGTSTTQMSFTNAMREHRDDNGNLMKARKQDTRTSIRLQLLNGNESDELLIYQDEAASNSYDTYDSPKMMNNSATVPDLYSKVNDERLVINGLNTIVDNTELPLGFSLNAAATLKFKVSELNSLPEGAKVYLRDKQENKETELTPTTEYSFITTTATTNNESRFSLIYKVARVVTGTTIPSNSLVSVLVNTANQITIIAKPNSKYSIYNADGQLIENGTLNSEFRTQNSKFAAGVYVVKVNNQSTKVIVK